MLASIDNMRTVARLCLVREPLPEALAIWLAASFGSFLEKRAGSLNDAFGVRNARGGVPWRMEASMRCRDEALRRLAADHFSTLSTSSQASNIRQLSARYAASNWRFDRLRTTMPAAYEGTPRAGLWRAFKSGAAMPLGVRQLRTILAT